MGGKKRPSTGKNATAKHTRAKTKNTNQHSPKTNNSTAKKKKRLVERPMSAHYDPFTNGMFGDAGMDMAVLHSEMYEMAEQGEYISLGGNRRHRGSTGQGRGRGGMKQYGHSAQHRTNGQSKKKGQVHVGHGSAGWSDSSESDSESSEGGGYSYAEYQAMMERDEKKATKKLAFEDIGAASNAVQGVDDTVYFTLDGSDPTPPTEMLIDTDARANTTATTTTTNTATTLGFSAALPVLSTGDKTDDQSDGVEYPEEPKRKSKRQIDDEIMEDYLRNCDDEDLESYFKSYIHNAAWLQDDFDRGSGDSSTDYDSDEVYQRQQKRVGGKGGKGSAKGTGKSNAQKEKELKRKLKDEKKAHKQTASGREKRTSKLVEHRLTKQQAVKLSSTWCKGEMQTDTAKGVEAAMGHARVAIATENVSIATDGVTVDVGHVTVATDHGVTERDDVSIDATHVAMETEVGTDSDTGSSGRRTDITPREGGEHVHVTHTQTYSRCGESVFTHKHTHTHTRDGVTTETVTALRTAAEVTDAEIADAASAQMDSHMSILSLKDVESKHESSMSHGEPTSHAGLGYNAAVPVYMQSPHIPKARPVYNKLTGTTTNEPDHGTFVRTPRESRTIKEKRKISHEHMAYDSSSTDDDCVDTFSGLGFGGKSKKALYDEDGFDMYIDSEMAGPGFDLYSSQHQGGPRLNRSEKKAKRAAERLAMRESGEVKRSLKQHTPIPDSNLGSKMLRAMGWSEGTGLGKHRDGRTVPVLATRNNGRKGLGTS